MVSSGGGTEPRWSADGKELFDFSGQTLIAVPVSLRPTFSNALPRAFFDARFCLARPPVAIAGRSRPTAAAFYCSQMTESSRGHPSM